MARKRLQQPAPVGDIMEMWYDRRPVADGATFARNDLVTVIGGAVTKAVAAHLGTATNRFGIAVEKSADVWRDPREGHIFGNQAGLVNVAQIGNGRKSEFNAHPNTVYAETLAGRAYDLIFVPAGDAILTDDDYPDGVMLVNFASTANPRFFVEGLADTLLGGTVGDNAVRVRGYLLNTFAY